MKFLNLVFESYFNYLLSWQIQIISVNVIIINPF